MTATASEVAAPGARGPGGMSPRQTSLLLAVFLLSAVTGVLHYAGAGAVLTFIVAGVALGGLAWAIGFATEAVGDRFGPAVTGVLQSTLGNLPELFVVLFALGAGETVVAQTSIIGSLFANALLVLGMTILAGSHVAPDGVMRYAKRLPNDTATLLLLAVFIIVLLGLSDQVGDRASQHAEAISIAGAICLLIVYAFWLWGYLRGAPTPEAAGSHEAAGAPHIGLVMAVVLLALSGVGAALVSEWFVAELDPAVRELGVSKAFTGLVIVAIAGNAVEHFVGVTLAWKGKSELAISVVKNSVAQIAAFLFPALVLLSFFFATPLTFVLAPVYVGALALMAIAVWQITGDGESVAFEGWALVALYVVVAVLAYYE
jgi:Ca2+:H+ antiporter